MKKYSLFINFILIFLINEYLTSQSNITIQPYLQDANPHSIHILWETDFGQESVVEWGLTRFLGRQTSGISYPAHNGNEMVHEVFIDSLNRFTKYYYCVKTDGASSDTFSFKTPPFSSDNKSFKVVAMSDMQQDGAFPDKFREVVEDGVLTYLEDELGGDLVDNLALIMIPGDLVQNGNNFRSWQRTFFQPAEKLFSHVPVYPVPGNHENDAIFFFTYFKLPTNGSTGFEEHWWHKDYGNVRIIGLDSNSPYNGIQQLEWLDNVLETTCSLDSIQFVFAQLHHPHKSELWTPGESNFTGEVIDRLEQFSTDCGKTSIHFFGHTHGYSRGQSRDHKHLWINVASAGGAIDNWGEFPNFDYDEFSVSQDEYGFVLLEITAGPDPQLVVKRISRGDQDHTLANQLRDSLTVRFHPTIVHTPISERPIDDALAPECVILEASSFSSPSLLALHGQSHWQVDTSKGDFLSPVFESWKNYENWYFEEDTQANDDLTDEIVQGLQEFTSYQWRVRYRDRELNWSEWSDPVAFSTKASIAPPNLLLNPGSEDSLNHWTIIEGVVESVESNDCNGIKAYSGNRYFAVGGICEHSDVGRLIQNIDISSYSDSIDAGGFTTNFGGYLSNFSGSDQPEMKLIFLDENKNEINQSSTLTSLNSSWTKLVKEATIPINTRHIRLELKGTKNSGTDNDCYFDQLFLNVGQYRKCQPITTFTQNSIPFKELEVFPNPSHGITTVKIPLSISDDLIDCVALTDMLGNKIMINFEKKNQHLIIQTSNLPSGNYTLYVRGRRGIIGVAKMILIAK